MVVRGGADLHLVADPPQSLSDAGVNTGLVPRRTADAPARGPHQLPCRQVLTGQWAPAVALATGTEVRPRRGGKGGSGLYLAGVDAPLQVPCTQHPGGDEAVVHLRLVTGVSGQEGHHG